MNNKTHLTRALELAAQFPSSQPMALAREIYDFIRESEE